MIELFVWIISNIEQQQKWNYPIGKEDALFYRQIPCNTLVFIYLGSKPYGGGIG